MSQYLRSIPADAGIAVRSLRRSPGFVVASVLSLGLAIGAGRGRILAMVIVQAMRLALVGTALGLAVAVAAMPLLDGLLYGTPRNDLAVYASVSAIALAAALAASWIPARRASRVDPVIALKAM